MPVWPPANGAFNFGSATTLIETPYFASLPTRSYDVSRDGQKFVMIKAAPINQQTASAAPPPRTSMVVVLNWFEEPRARVPVKPWRIAGFRSRLSDRSP